MHPGKHPPFYVLGQWERQWDYDLVSLAADARVTLDANLVGLQVPRTSEAASWEPNVVYEELQWCTLTCISEERREEAINRLLKPAAPPDSGNGVVVPHEAPDGRPSPRRRAKNEPNSIGADASREAPMTWGDS